MLDVGLGVVLLAMGGAAFVAAALFNFAPSQVFAKEDAIPEGVFIPVSPVAPVKREEVPANAAWSEAVATRKEQGVQELFSELITLRGMVDDLAAEVADLRAQVNGTKAIES